MSPLPERRQISGRLPVDCLVLQPCPAGLSERSELIAKCQKLINIVDHSKHSWGVVAEYTINELAKDSDYKKRLEKAERAVEQKAAKHRKKRANAALWRSHGPGQSKPSVLVTA